ncbi:MAG: OB-fold putative lipoprotein [Candidatus Adiutrix sp.]|jgi:hypothetical protein|nr:OB-fold putative lipoprotein [Candidatus Adiutrix sp.]
MLKPAWIGPALGLVFLFRAGPAAAQRYYMEPLEVSPAQLVEAYQNNFHQADALYTGKLLLVTGRVRSIRPRAQRPYNYHYDKIYAFLTLDSGRNLPLAVYFWDWQAERVNSMRVGSTVTVMGFCQGVPPQLSLREACLYPNGCGGPKGDFYGPYYEIPPSPPPARRPAF